MANSKYNKYIGARYVPLFMGEWDIQKTYEPLMIVSYQGNSYTSKTFVPKNIQISNTVYWALTGNYNAQVDAYRQEVENVKTDITDLSQSTDNKFLGIKTINISQYPRINEEYDDAPRIQRAIDYLHSIGGGLLLLNGDERYYMKTKNFTDCFVKLYKNISIDGNNGTIYLDDNSATSVSGVFKDLDTQNATFKNIIFDTSLITIIDDTDFYDMFYLRYTTNGNVNVHWENIKFLGKAYQSPINFSIVNENTATVFGRNVSIKNCEIFQTGYPTCINDLLYENVIFNVDLEVKRPSWNDGYSQTPFKFSAKSGYCTGIKMVNCTVNISGERNPIVLFEVFRCKAEITNLIVNKNTTRNMWANIGSATSKDYGISNNPTELTMNNCNISGYSLYYAELGMVVLNNCNLSNSVNTLLSTYKIAEKQSTLDKANGTMTLNGCTIQDNCNRITFDSGNTEVEFNNCFIYYDRAKSPSNGINGGTDTTININNCIVILNGTGGAYLFALSSIANLNINGITVMKGSYEGLTTDYLIWFSGTCKNVSIQGYYNPLRTKGSPIIRLQSATIANRNIQMEQLFLTANNKDYKVTINSSNQLEVTEVV